MKKSKTDLFIILYPRGRNQWEWEAGGTGVPLIHCSEGGTEESKQITGRDVAFIEGWTQCSLLAGQEVAPFPCATRTHRRCFRFVFFKKETQNLFKDDIWCNVRRFELHFIAKILSKLILETNKKGQKWSHENKSAMTKICK